MSAVREAAEQIVTALATLRDLPVVTDTGASLQPPAVVVGPPRLAWETPCADPTEATFLLYVVVAADEWALPALWELVPQVAGAIEEHTDAVVTTAEPGAYQAGNADLPCYELTVEMPL